MVSVRFWANDHAAYGVVRDGIIYEVQDSPFCMPLRETGTALPLEGARLLAPVTPSKIFAVGKNYYNHVMEFDSQVPTSPIIFTKPPVSVIGPGETIVRPAISTRVDYEGELAVVVGKRARNVKACDFADYVFGYTVLNDVTARDLQRLDGQWTRGKGFDTFCPIGPWITDEVDANSLDISTELNGKTVQSSNTSRFLFSLGEIFEFVTRFSTLLPGDVIATGTPEGVGPMKSGDVVSVTVQGVGTLTNTVADEIDVETPRKEESK